MSGNKLSKGVFWYKRGELLPFFIPCDKNGAVYEASEYPLESKDGTNYNHQKLWARLPRTVTESRPFDFYPRGRVEIGEGRATVFLHPSLFVPDGSANYHAEVQEFS